MRLKLALILFLISIPAFADSGIKWQNLGECTEEKNGEYNVVYNAPVNDVCPTSGASGNGVALCVCKQVDGAWKWAAGGAASTAQAPPRTVYVKAGATELPGSVYNTVKKAADYVATKEPLSTAPWRINVQGGGKFVETAFTLPRNTELNCEVGGNPYTFDVGVTKINTAQTSGTFITMIGGSSIRGCEIEATNSETAPRKLVYCAGGPAAFGFACELFDTMLAIYSFAAGPGDFEDIAFDIAGTSGNGTAYANFQNAYVWVLGANPNAIGVRIGGNSSIRFFGGFIAATGTTVGTGLSITSTAGFGGVLKNIWIGSETGSASNVFANDISTTGNGTVYLEQVNYTTSTGNAAKIVSMDTERIRKIAALGVCNDFRRGVILYDSSTNEYCGCGGAGPAWAPLDGAGTCD